jgi:hypothetical protein
MLYHSLTDNRPIKVEVHEKIHKDFFTGLVLVPIAPSGFVPLAQRLVTSDTKRYRDVAARTHTRL